MINNLLFHLNNVLIILLSCGMYIMNNLILYYKNHLYHYLYYEIRFMDLIIIKINQNIHYIFTSIMVQKFYISFIIHKFHLYNYLNNNLLLMMLKLKYID